MKSLRCVLLAMQEDLDLAQSLAEDFGSILPHCRVETWTSGDEPKISDCSVAVFVTRATRASATRDLVEKLGVGTAACTLLVAGSELTADQQLGMLAAGAADFLAMPCGAAELKTRLYRAAGLLPTPPSTYTPDPRLCKFIGRARLERRQLDLDRVGGFAYQRAAGKLGPRCGDHEQRLAPIRGDVVEHEDKDGVGPMNVLDDDQGRGVGRQVLDLSDDGREGHFLAALR